MVLPPGCKDRISELTLHCEVVFHNCAKKSLSSKFAWHEIKEALKASKNPVYLNHEGVVVGLPSELDHKYQGIRDTLVQIVQGKKQPLTSIESSIPPIRQSLFFQKRRIGDSQTALLAAMYQLVKNNHTRFTKAEIAASAKGFTDLSFDYDKFSHEYGIWKSIQELEKNRFVTSFKNPGSYANTEYQFTQDGLLMCRALFTHRFHPSLSRSYPLIRPEGLLRE